MLIRFSRERTSLRPRSSLPPRLFSLELVTLLLSARNFLGLTMRDEMTGWSIARDGWTDRRTEERIDELQESLRPVDERPHSEIENKGLRHE